MQYRVNIDARSIQTFSSWPEFVIEFLSDTWSLFENGYGFVAARCVKTKKWEEIAIPLDNRKHLLRRFFESHDRKDFDLYFCPNGFNRPERRHDFALQTPYAWVDIDEADVEAFDPRPGILLETSPGRHQGIWVFKDYLCPFEAEQYSKALAYNFNADRTGWSVTKYLRVPLSFNHKPRYHRPRVKVIRGEMFPRSRKSLVMQSAGRDHSLMPAISIKLSSDIDAVTVVTKYRRHVHPRVRELMKSTRAYGFERDRSKCIFEIIAGLHTAGALPDEIGAVLWVNPYFISKHGQNINQLNLEISRVLGKLADQS